MLMYEAETWISELIELYGVDRILEDNQLTIQQVITLLEDLGYLELDMYKEDEI